MIRRPPSPDGGVENEIQCREIGRYLRLRRHLSTNDLGSVVNGNEQLAFTFTPRPGSTTFFCRDHFDVALACPAGGGRGGHGGGRGRHEGGRGRHYFGSGGHCDGRNEHCDGRNEHCDGRNGYCDGRNGHCDGRNGYCEGRNGYCDGRGEKPMLPSPGE